MAEQFCLRWNNHQSTLVSVFENLLESETLTDCTLAAEGRYLKAHKVVLSACSPYFETILCQHYDKHPIVVLKDVKFYEMRAMLDYMYRGEVNISQDQLDAFIKTAESLQIKGLTDQGGGGGGGMSGDSDERDVGSTKRKCSSLKSTASDIAPESPLVGNTPLREGSTSPSSLKRRRRQRHTSQGNGEAPDSHVDTSNSCDIPPQMLGASTPVPNASVTAAAANSSSSRPQQSLTPELGRFPVKKTEPPDIIQPKIEMDDHSDDVEDLTLDDDEDYGGGSDLSKPGTSYSGPTGQDYSQWQMTGERTTDEVFMAAQEAINNQSNSQGPETVARTTLNEFGYMCYICKTPFMTLGELSKHSVENHADLTQYWHPNKSMELDSSGRFECEECGAVFKYSRNLKEHMKAHTGYTMCGACNKVLSSRANLRRHLIMLHTRDSLCLICNKEFDISGLQNHMCTQHTKSF